MARFAVAAALVLVALVACEAFAPRAAFQNAKMVRHAPRFGDSPKYDIVPVSKETVQASTIVSGSVVGFLLAGPIGALVTAALSAYLVKKEDSLVAEALAGVGKSVVEAYNYLNKVNTKYDLTTKVTAAVSEAVDKASAESETVANAKSKVLEVASQASSVISEYDLTTKAAALAKASVELSESAIEKLDDLNRQYDLIEVAKTTASGVVEKARNAVKSE
jgi:hypothetical protein